MYPLCNAWPVSTIGSVSDYEGPLDRAHQEVAGSSPVLVIFLLSGSMPGKFYFLFLIKPGLGENGPNPRTAPWPVFGRLYLQAMVV